MGTRDSGVAQLISLVSCAYLCHGLPHLESKRSDSCLHIISLCNRPNSNRLDIFLTTYPEYFSTSMSVPIRRMDHALIYVFCVCSYRCTQVYLSSKSQQNYFIM